MKVILTCPQHGDWHPDLASARSTARCPAPGCKTRRKPSAAQFRAAQPRAAREDAPRPATAPEPDNEVRLADVDEATAPLHPALRALTRLMLSAASARHHLRQARTGGHLSGIAAGPTQRGKTLVAAIICRALGLDEVTAIRQVAREAELSLWGRRVQEPGGRYVLAPSTVLALPFVALDELDKATGTLRKAALRLLQGDARVDAEGQPVDVAPAAYATSNTDLGVLPESYRRRSACLDAARLPQVPYAQARQILDRVPRLPFQHLAPPRGELPADAVEQMQTALRACLTSEGWALCDLRALELAALGRAALTGTGDLAAAAVATADDYLACALTTGEADPRTVASLRRWLAGEDQDAPGDDDRDDLEDLEEPEPDPAEQYQDQVAAIGVAGALRHQLGLAVADLADAADQPGVPAGWQAEAAGIMEESRRVGRDLAKVDTPGRLMIVAPAADTTLQHALDLAGRIRSAAAAAIAAGAAGELTAALDAELHRRLQLQEAARAAITSGPPPELPPAGFLAAARQSAAAAMGPSATTARARPAIPYPSGGMRLRTNWHTRPELNRSASKSPHLGTAVGPRSVRLIALADQAKAVNARKAQVLQDLHARGATSQELNNAALELDGTTFHPAG